MTAELNYRIICSDVSVQATYLFKLCLWIIEVGAFYDFRELGVQADTKV